MRGDWQVTQDGYHRETRFADDTGRVIGEVNGSEFTKEWTSYYWSERPPKWLGKFTSERAAQDAVMQEIAAREGK